ncbi:ABC transporter permease [Kiloniella majae]|uniref:ABC transporter permease n=1 Tax=Kiloniella majae TaxID=1938558 RepID=UPI000A2779F8|nr:ABC transporter permease subunit [Kiloniella majae]
MNLFSFNYLSFQKCTLAQKYALALYIQTQTVFKKHSFFLLFFGLLIGLVLLGFAMTPYDPVETNFLNRLSSPSWKNWFGTDQMGRDIATRILYGAGWSVGLALIVSTAGAVIGMIIGLLAGSLGRFVDGFCMRMTDSFFAFPELIAAIVITGVLGPNTVNMVIALILVSWMRFARLVRALTGDIKQRDYVVQAKLNKLPYYLILSRHYLPNIILSVVVIWTSSWSRTILSISGLSFLGFGVQPPQAEWGAMLLDGKPYMLTAPHVMIFPGIAVLVTVLILNLMGDHFRDHLQSSEK